MRASQCDFSVAELHFQVGDSGLGGIAVRLRRLERALIIGIVEGGKKLALFNGCAFIKENAGDASGNFCSDRGAAAWRDVPARIQCRQRALGIRLGRRRDLHDRLLLPQRESSGNNGAKNNHRYGGVKHTPAHARLGALTFVDA